MHGIESGEHTAYAVNGAGSAFCMAAIQYSQLGKNVSYMKEVRIQDVTLFKTDHGDLKLSTDLNRLLKFLHF